MSPASARARGKDAAKRSIRALVNTVYATRLGRFVVRQILEMAMQEVRDVSHHAVPLRFAAPNPLCDWRALTFADKEPETLDWIDGLPESSVLWDVGANVGLYSVYAAKARRCQVWAFEPSVFNLELLARNVYLNGLTERICIVPLALSDALQASQMRLTTTEWGGAMSTFGKTFGWDGEAIRQVFEFRTIGMRMDDAAGRLAIPLPDYIKMDVDGLEHFILQGGPSVLSQVKEILIEVNDDFTEQAEQCRDLLTAAGLELKAKLHSEYIENSVGFNHTFNQIWVRR
jgi:FkbM family methyltransferase